MSRKNVERIHNMFGYESGESSQNSSLPNRQQRSTSSYEQNVSSNSPNSEEEENRNSASMTEEGDDESVQSQRSTQSLKLQRSDFLDCPTCMEPLQPPIYQCNNGHLACSLCCFKLGKRCSACRSHNGAIRCRAMENIVETTIVPCKNSNLGCRVTPTYANQSIHKIQCLFIPCSCPYCNYTSTYIDLKAHAQVAHSNQIIPFTFDKPFNFAITKRVVFQEEREDDLIVVQVIIGSHGAYVTVSCIAPMDPGICNFSCNIEHINEDKTLRMGLKVKKIQKVEEEDEIPRDGFMLIPSYMLNRDFLNLKICITSHA